MSSGDKRRASSPSPDSLPSSNKRPRGIGYNEGAILNESVGLLTPQGTTRITTPDTTRHVENNDGDSPSMAFGSTLEKLVGKEIEKQFANARASFAKFQATQSEQATKNFQLRINNIVAEAVNAETEVLRAQLNEKTNISSQLLQAENQSWIAEAVKSETEALQAQLLENANIQSKLLQAENRSWIAEEAKSTETRLERYFNVRISNSFEDAKIISKAQHKDDYRVDLKRMQSAQEKLARTHTEALQGQIDELKREVAQLQSASTKPNRSNYRGGSHSHGGQERGPDRGRGRGRGPGGFVSRDTYASSTPGPTLNATVSPKDSTPPTKFNPSSLQVASNPSPGFGQQSTAQLSFSGSISIPRQGNPGVAFGSGSSRTCYSTK